MNTGFVLRLINTYGEDCVFSPKPTTQGYDPYTAEAVDNQSTTYSVKGVPEEYKAQEIDGTVVKIGDIKLHIANTGYTPAVSDTCLIDSVTYRVMNVDKVRLQGSTVLFTLGLRK